MDAFFLGDLRFSQGVTCAAQSVSQGRTKIIFALHLYLLVGVRIVFEAQTIAWQPTRSSCTPTWRPRRTRDHGTDHPHCMVNADRAQTSPTSTAARWRGAKRSGTNSQQGRLHYFLPLLRLAQRAAPSASACQLVRKSASQPAMEICRRTAVREILDNRQRRAAACQPSGPGSGLWVRCGRALPGQFGSRVVSRIVFASQTQTTPTRRYEGRNWSSSWREALSAMPPRAIGWPCIVPTAMSSGRTAVRMTRPEGVGSRYVCSSTPEV